MTERKAYVPAEDYAELAQRANAERDARLKVIRMVDDVVSESDPDLRNSLMIQLGTSGLLAMHMHPDMQSHVAVDKAELERLRAIEKTLEALRARLPHDDDLSDYGLGRKNVIDRALGGA